MPYRRGVLLGNFFEDSFAGAPAAPRVSHVKASHSHRVHDGRQITDASGDEHVESSLPSYLLFGHCGDEQIASFAKRRLGTTKQLAESEISGSFAPGKFGFPEVPRRPRHAQKISALLSVQTEDHLKAYLAGSAALSAEISDQLKSPEPLSEAELAAVPAEALAERLALLSEVALRQGLVEISDHLLGLGEILGDGRKMRPRRDLLNFVRSGQGTKEISDPEKSVQEVVSHFRSSPEISDLLRLACVLHRLKKLAAIYRSMKISSALEKIGVQSVEEISRASLWSLQTQGVPRVCTEISGDWLRLSVAS